MKTTDAQDFHELLSGVLGFYAKPQPGDIEAQIWWETMQRFELSDIRAALTAHIQHPERGRFAPKPADVIAAMQERIRSQWPSADEAWATALQASDERATVVWSEEASKAFADCQPIMASGDAIGARMAFKASYERELQQAIRELRTPRHTVSLGHDPAQRIEAVELAVQRGQLAHEHGERLLLGARKEAGETTQAVAGLIAGRVGQPRDSATAKKHLAGLMAKIKGASGVADMAAARREKQREAEAKAQAKDDVARAVGGAA